MKVALVHDHVGGAGGGGGGVRQMLQLARGLREAGAEVTVVCHDFEPETDLEQISDDIEVRSVRRGISEALIGQRMVWRRQFRGMPRVAELVPADADVINAHEWPALRAGSLAARRLHIPLVWTRNDDTMLERAVFPGEVTIHPGSVTSRVRHGLYGLPDLFDARSAERIVVLDERNASLVRRVYRRPATIVRSGPAPHFFDPPDRAESRASLGLDDGAVVALGVGIMMPHRRFEDLIEALERVGDERYRGLVLGWDGIAPDYADRLEAVVRERGLDERVEVIRRSVPDEELRRLYAAADVFVFPNQRQTWGLAPLEALAGGTPAVVSSGAGVHEVLEGRPGVWVVPPEDPGAIAAALREAATSDARNGIRKTVQWIRDELNRRRYAEHMVEVFQETLR